MRFLSGRFDFHVQLPAPAVLERGAILKHEISKRSLQCSEDILCDIASKCDGYDAYDLVFFFLFPRINLIDCMFSLEKQKDK